MKNTIHTIDDLAKEIGQDEIQGCDIREWSGKLITFSGVKSDGYYEPLADVTYFIPDDRSTSVARNANNGWELLGMYGFDLTRDDILDAVHNDQSLDDEAANAEADEICAALNIEDEA